MAKQFDNDTTTTEKEVYKEGNQRESDQRKVRTKKRNASALRIEVHRIERELCEEPLKKNQ